MKRQLFLIPGFKQKSADRNFVWLKKFLELKGFSVIGVPIRWNYRTMSDYVREFKEFYGRHGSRNDYFLGFSYGAVIAFMTARELKPRKLYLCSLSPDFREDLKAMKPGERKLIGKRRFADAKTRSARKIGRRLSVPVVLFYGEKEGKKYPALRIRAEETAKLAKRAKLIVVRNAPHKINHPEYIAAIKRIFGSYSQ